MKNFFLLFCVSFIIYACNSTPAPDTHFFVLTPNAFTTTDDLSVSSNVTSDKIVALKPIKLAEFLDQPGIILQTGTHEIEVAHYNRWAEPLQRNLHRYVLQSLATQLPQYHFQTNNNFQKTETHKELEITLNQFNGTADGLALLSGHWILVDKNLSPIKNTFTYRTKLTDSGYPELVDELGKLLDMLCSDISKSF